MAQQLPDTKTLEFILTMQSTPEKLEAAVKTLLDFGEWMMANEPGALELKLWTEVTEGAAVIYVHEVYADKAALDAHHKSDTFKAFQQKAVAEGLVTGPPKVAVVENRGGFAR